MADLKNTANKYKEPKEGYLMFIPGKNAVNSELLKKHKVLAKFEIGKGVELLKDDALKLQNAKFGKIKKQ